ncbi:AAA family ATPase [Methanobacterium movens]
MHDFKKPISNLLKARFPYIYIPTWEEERALEIIKSIAVDEKIIKTKRKVFTWKITSGLVDSDYEVQKNTQDALKALEFVENYEEDSIFIFLDFHVFLGAKNTAIEPRIIRKLRDLIITLKNSPIKKNIIFISPTLVLPEDLQKDVTILDFDLPNFDEIKEFLEEMILENEQAGRIIIDINEEEKEKLVKAAVGLTLQEAENAFARAMVDDGRLDINDLRIILDEKQQIIKKIGILEFIESDVNISDVGGLENLKKWLNKRNKSWLDSAKNYGIPSPKGLLITGVPGCGKSLVAKSISSMWQLPLLRLDVSRIFSGIVGSSEENMRKAIKVAEALSPSVLWIDEIEKGFGGIGSSGDSGTSTRVFGTFLTWMQEKTKPVFVVATANNIEYLPSEFLRKGRFDEIFFVDLPTNKERVEIFKLHLLKRLKSEEARGSFELKEDILEELAEITEGFGGAEIEQIVINGLFDAFSEDRGLELIDLKSSISNTIPLSITQQERITKLREWANLRAVAATSTDYMEDYEHDIRDEEEPKKPEILSSRGGRSVDF